MKRGREQLRNGRGEREGGGGMGGVREESISVSYKGEGNGEGGRETERKLGRHQIRRAWKTPDKKRGEP